MQVANYHTNHIRYCFHFVAHAATGTPNLYVGEKKGRKDSPLKGDFDCPIPFYLQYFMSFQAKNLYSRQKASAFM